MEKVFGRIQSKHIKTFKTNFIIKTVYQYKEMKIDQFRSMLTRLMYMKSIYCLNRTSFQLFVS